MSSSSGVKAMIEGPLHEAFLSPMKDGVAQHVAKAPPEPITERPAVDPPNASAQWIDGYWEWDAAKNDYLWVTGTWRVPPPGRFWVNGYWKRDDKGWYRVAGFWSDRKTDRLDFRKFGPPAQRPDENPGPAPDDQHFWVPGQYQPDGDGVLWKPGFWAKAQPGWSWVPAQCVKQPEGWAFQEGFWDRTLEDRGTLFAPAEVSQDARKPETVYQPYTEVSPELYGMLYGAYGRPNSYYDGYPGCSYDADGRFYAYANYGSLGTYQGYLDYPYNSGVGSPYYASQPQTYAYAGGVPSYYGMGYGGCGLGMGYYGLGGMFGLGYGGFGLGLGFGYPYYGFGYPFYGLGGFGYPFYGGYGGFGGFGYPYYGFGGYGGFGYPFYGGFGLGLGFGYGGFGLGFGYPFFG
ncbi:MAG: YXWGXW repeat-containing protein, partial [Planctomycetota bacterium]|nr:YXWGXW repeat-containing protein [Planctomycetota bacterium]